MKWLWLLLFAAGLGLIRAPAVHSGFVPRATFQLAVGTGEPVASEYRLARSGAGSCENEIDVRFEPEAPVEIERTGSTLVLTSQQDETVISGSFHGNCEETKELGLQYLAESSTAAVPVFLLNASSVNAFIGEEDWEIEFTLVFPTKDDKLYLHGWEEREVITASSAPTLTSAGSWVVLQPQNWQQYWHSHLTWPEAATDYFFPPDCHSVSHLFFGKQTDSPCRSSTTSPVATRLPAIRSWYGWKSGSESEWLSLPPPRSPSPGEIRITEVMWAGSFSTLNHSADEWVELLNTTDEYLSLDGLQLLKAKSGGETLMFPTGLKIEPHAYFVIGKPTGESLLSRPADWQTRNLSLSNTEASMSLQTTTGVVIDSLPNGIWEAGENDVSRKQRSSAQLKHLSLPSDQWSSWTNCSREDEQRCWLQTSQNWKSNSAKNLTSPWKASVL